VFSDPTVSGYGHYKYDDEGVLAQRVDHVIDGILTADFLNSRETAQIMRLMGIHVEPNGAVRAMDPVVVGLIRMTNTSFAPGTSDPADIISGVDNGWYFKFSRVPSISEDRGNFRISAEETWHIVNGELEGPYRDGSISADSFDFMMKVDAVCGDYLLYPVFNCGKGSPMQGMRVGNGSPTMRSYGKVVGGHMK
jgi:TldD protein